MPDRQQGGSRWLGSAFPPDLAKIFLHQRRGCGCDGAGGKEELYKRKLRCIKEEREEDKAEDENEGDDNELNDEHRRRPTKSVFPCYRERG